MRTFHFCMHTDLSGSILSKKWPNVVHYSQYNIRPTLITVQAYIKSLCRANCTTQTSIQVNTTNQSDIVYIGQFQTIKVVVGSRFSLVPFRCTAPDKFVEGSTSLVGGLKMILPVPLLGTSMEKSSGSDSFLVRDQRGFLRTGKVWCLAPCFSATASTSPHTATSFSGATVMPAPDLLGD